MVFLIKEVKTCFQQSSYRKHVSTPIFTILQDRKMWIFTDRYLGVLK